MEKQCKKCDLIKSLDGFYTGSYECKECVKKRVRDREARLRQDPEWVIKERKRGREKYHRLYENIDGSGTPQAKKKWIERNKLKRMAHHMVSNAIRDGRLIKKPCEVCGKEAESHHEDYYKPLEVTWLCIKHHNAHHVKQKELETYGHTR